MNLRRRFLEYYNINRLETETKKNNSLIYKAILKYGYSNFKLDILEYCKPNLVSEREQYYLNLFEPEYNILKFARSMTGFKHSIATIKKMREAKLGHKRSETARLNSIAANTQAHTVIVTNNKTGENIEFFSIRNAAKFIGMNHTYIAKILFFFCLVKFYIIMRK